MATADPSERLHTLTVEDYHRMIDAEILTEEDRVELLEGVLIEMSPEGPAHAAVISRLMMHIAPHLAGGPLTLRVQSPVTLPPTSEPEPDLVVVDAAASNFAAHPSSAHLVIEVSHSSRRIDRVRKLRIYATAGVPEYWIVDLVDLVVDVHREPQQGAYREITRAAPGEALTPASVELPPLDIAELLDDGC